MIIWLFDLQLPVQSVSAYHHKSCEIEPRPWPGVLVQLYLITFVTYKQQEVKTNTNNVNKTCVLLQTTGHKDKHK